jgi:hypothetical protein
MQKRASRRGVLRLLTLALIMVGFALTGKPETIDRAMRIVRYRKSFWTQLSRISTAAHKFKWLQGLRKQLKASRNGAPGRFELPTFWFVASRPTLPNLARAGASGAKSVSWDDPWQLTLSFTLPFLFANCHPLPPLA